MYLLEIGDVAEWHLHKSGSIRRADMRDLLHKLFDYQKFENNNRLGTLITDTEYRYDRMLSDEELELVSAAGDVFPDPPSPSSGREPDRNGKI